MLLESIADDDERADGVDLFVASTDHDYLSICLSSKRMRVCPIIDKRVRDGDGRSCYQNAPQVACTHLHGVVVAIVPVVGIGVAGCIHECRVNPRSVLREEVNRISLYPSCIGQCVVNVDDDVGGGLDLRKTAAR